MNGPHAAGTLISKGASQRNASYLRKSRKTMHLFCRFPRLCPSNYSSLLLARQLHVKQQNGGPYFDERIEGIVKKIALSVILLFCGVVAAVGATGTLVVPKDVVQSVYSQLMTSVPEPSGLILLGVGMLGAAYALRRIARSTQATPAPSEEHPE